MTLRIWSGFPDVWQEYLYNWGLAAAAYTLRYGAVEQRRAASSALCRRPCRRRCSTSGVSCSSWSVERGAASCPLLQRRRRGVSVSSLLHVVRRRRPCRPSSWSVARRRVLYYSVVVSSCRCVPLDDVACRLLQHRRGASSIYYVAPRRSGWRGVRPAGRMAWRVRGVERRVRRVGIAGGSPRMAWRASCCAGWLVNRMQLRHAGRRYHDGRPIMWRP